MQLKKSPSANLETQRLTYVLVGLVFALSVLYVAFEMTESDIVVAEITDQIVEDAEEEMIDNSIQDEETPPPPEPEELPQEIMDEFTIVEDDKQVENVEFKSEDDQNTKVELHVAPVHVEVEEEDEDQIFDVVEEQPEFPGGMAALQKYFRENLKYPVMAQEMNIQGRVTVQFTVWKDGSVRDVRVLKSADQSLDKEAIRLVSRMPKWKPGKQRGKAVNCKYVVPVVFKLAH